MMVINSEYLDFVTNFRHSVTTGVINATKDGYAASNGSGREDRAVSNAVNADNLRMKNMKIIVLSNK